MRRDVFNNQVLDVTGIWCFHCLVAKDERFSSVITTVNAEFLMKVAACFHVSVYLLTCFIYVLIEPGIPHTTNLRIKIHWTMT